MVTAAPYWDATGLTGVELGRARNPLKIGGGGVVPRTVWTSCVSKVREDLGEQQPSLHPLAHQEHDRLTLTQEFGLLFS